MPVYEYSIGPSVVGLVTLASLGIPAPETEFTPFSVTLQTGSGIAKGMGWPVCEWHFGFLTETQRDALKAYSAGQSAEVFIRTLDEDLDYANYECVLVWPKNERRSVGASIDVTLLFQRLVVQV